MLPLDAQESQQWTVQGVRMLKQKALPHHAMAMQDKQN